MKYEIKNPESRDENISQIIKNARNTTSTIAQKNRRIRLLWINRMTQREGTIDTTYLIKYGWPKRKAQKDIRDLIKLGILKRVQPLRT